MYHSQHYQDYSFEELRLFAPKVERYNYMYIPSGSPRSSQNRLEIKVSYVPGPQCTFQKYWWYRRTEYIYMHTDDILAVVRRRTTKFPAVLYICVL